MNVQIAQIITMKSDKITRCCSLYSIGKFHPQNLVTQINFDIFPLFWLQLPCRFSKPQFLHKTFTIRIVFVFNTISFLSKIITSFSMHDISSLIYSFCNYHVRRIMNAFHQHFINIDHEYIMGCNQIRWQCKLISNFTYSLENLKQSYISWIQLPRFAKSHHSSDQ